MAWFEFKILLNGVLFAGTTEVLHGIKLITNGEGMFGRTHDAWKIRGFVEGLKAVIVKRGLFGVLHVEIQVIRGGPVGCVSRG